MPHLAILRDQATALGDFMRDNDFVVAGVTAQPNGDLAVTTWGGTGFDPEQQHVITAGGCVRTVGKVAA